MFSKKQKLIRNIQQDLKSKICQWNKSVFVALRCEYLYKELRLCTFRLYNVNNIKYLHVFWIQSISENRFEAEDRTDLQKPE